MSTSKRILVSILLAILAVSLFCAPVLAENAYFKIPVKKLLAEPKKGASEVYEIPLDVKLLGMSEDRNWFKVRIEFDLVFLGHYKYTGWVYAPIGELLKEAPLPKEEE